MRTLQITIDLASMGDNGDLDSLPRIINEIDDPVIPDTNSIKVLKTRQLCTTMRSRTIAQAVRRAKQSFLEVPWQVLE